MAEKKEQSKKQNIELRFFVDPSTAKSLIKHWKCEGFHFDPYSFSDFYFRSERSSKKLAKVRKWKKPKRPIEIIFFSRDKGVKTEERKKMKNFAQASNFLEGMGYESYLTIDKKKAWMVKKDGTEYAFEFIPELGWTGEVEIPVGEKHRLNEEIAKLKLHGAKTFSLSSLLDAMEKKKGLKMHKKPKMYRYKFLKI